MYNSTQDLDPCPCADNAHVCVLPKLSLFCHSFTPGIHSLRVSPLDKTIFFSTKKRKPYPDPDGSLKETVRIKIRHYRNVYWNLPDPIVFIPVAVDTTGHEYDDFIRLLFLHSHHESSTLSNELPEEADQFRFLRSVCFAHLKGAVG